MNSSYELDILSSTNRLKYTILYNIQSYSGMIIRRATRLLSGHVTPRFYLSTDLTERSRIAPDTFAVRQGRERKG
jgi:hypothetical protein